VLGDALDHIVAIRRPALLQDPLPDVAAHFVGAEDHVPGDAVDALDGEVDELVLLDGGEAGGNGRLLTGLTEGLYGSHLPVECAVACPVRS
jgi:hypothetical protein